MKKTVQIKRRSKRRRVCPLCADKQNVLDYKEINKVSRFVTDRGRIVPKRNSGVCARHQRVVEESVKRARYMGLIPYTLD